MNSQIEFNLSILETLIKNSNYKFKPVITKHTKAIAFLCQHSISKDGFTIDTNWVYKTLFQIYGITNETLDYAGNIANFIIYCNIYNIRQEYSIMLARNAIQNFDIL